MYPATRLDTDPDTGIGIDIGIDSDHNQRHAVAEGLCHLLADTYTVYLKTHNYHWNVTGPMFHSLHQMFEQQYMELALAVDEIAERIRALGVRAPGSYAQYAALASVEEQAGAPEAGEMVAQLTRDQHTVVRTARGIVPTAQGLGDEPTADLLIARMRAHEKAAWMLRSTLA